MMKVSMAATTPVTLKLRSVVASTQANSVKAAVNDISAAASSSGLLTADTAADIPPNSPVSA